MTAMRQAMYMLHDADEARDAVQEVFVKLWETETEVRQPEAFVIRAVRNTCLNRIATTGKTERLSLRLPLDGEECEYEPQADTELVTRAVERLLTQREREVVEHVYRGGMSYKEAAEELGVSVAMVNKSIVGALKKLRSYFKTR